VGNLTRIVANMTNPGVGHVSRTLLLSKKQPDILLVSRGSATNIDVLAADEFTGVSQIRAFNVSNTTDLRRPYSYPTDGLRIGWGLRNSVGVAEHPRTGGLYSVENSADNIVRLSRDIHEDNPGEELNFHGFLNDTSTLGANHGYPGCFALWNTTDFPSQGTLTVGSQFSLDNNATYNDTYCTEQTKPPRLTFQAHTAPLDIKFTPSGDTAFISFHGSWNRDHPAGYKLSYVSFSADSGEPTEASDSVTAARDVLTAPDVSACSNRGACFRPVGLAFDAAGERLFVSSDATGEIWVVMRDGAGNGNGNGGGGATGGGTPTSTGGPGGGTSSAAAAAGLRHRGVGGEGWVVVLLTGILMAVGGLAFLG
jgi:glucose/arabinose dehydrogenase